MKIVPIILIFTTILPVSAANTSNAAKIEKAKALRAKSKFAAAKAILADVLNVEESAEAYKEMGNIFLLGERNLKEAQRYYEKALSVEPDYFPAINNLAIVALKNYEETIGASPGSGDSAYLDQAKSFFDRALKLNSSFPGTYSELAKYHFYRQDHATALETINLGLTLSSKDPNAYTVRGQILLTGFKRYDEALRDFLAAHRYNPNDPDQIYFLWVCYSKLGKAKDAATYRKKYQVVLKSQGLTNEEVAAQVEKLDAWYKNY